jgi:hypothetical protein
MSSKVDCGCKLVLQIVHNKRGNERAQDPSMMEAAAAVGCG